MSDRVFTGDTLLIKGTGRTDFQMETLMISIILYLIDY